MINAPFPNITSHPLYNNKEEWYYPEIDYYEMVENFRWTKTYLSDLMHYSFPVDHNLLMFYSGAFELKDGKEIRGKQQMFQFWNKQFNDELTKILQRMNPKLILDVGAGDGMLAKILSDRGFQVKATDDYSWPFEKRYFDVEKMDYKEALQKYQPDVVIGSWMPYESNWTVDFRKTKSVKHYILIGENEGGCTGGEWKKRKGWHMSYEEKASWFALCRTDDISFFDGKVFSMMMHHAGVYAFSRK